MNRHLPLLALAPLLLWPTPTLAQSVAPARAQLRTLAPGPIDPELQVLILPEMVVADLPNTIGGFALSPDGGSSIFSALLAEPAPDVCACSINNSATLYAQAVLVLEL